MAVLKAILELVASGMLLCRIAFPARASVYVPRADRQHPVDEQVADPLGVLVWLFVARFLAERFRIKEHTTSAEVAGFQVAALWEPQNVRGQAGTASQRLLRRDYLFRQRIFTDLAREGAVGAWMGTVSSVMSWALPSLAVAT